MFIFLESMAVMALSFNWARLVPPLCSAAVSWTTCSYLVRICSHCVDAGDIMLLEQVLEPSKTIAPTLCFASVSQTTCTYLVGIAVLALTLTTSLFIGMLLELSDTSTTIMLCVSFLELYVLTWWGWRSWRWRWRHQASWECAWTELYHLHHCALHQFLELHVLTKWGWRSWRWHWRYLASWALSMCLN